MVIFLKSAVSNFRVGGECAHVLAVILKLTDWLTEGLLDIPTQPACTSKPQTWDKPRGMKIVSEPVSSAILSKSGSTGRKRRPIIPVFIDNRHVELFLQFFNANEIVVYDNIAW